jgi:PAS domain S-box-containing protein
LKNLLIHISLRNSTDIAVFISIVFIIVLFCKIVTIIYLKHIYKRKNDELNNRKELFNTLCTNVGDVFIIYNVLNKKFDYISPNFEKVMGLSSKNLMKNRLKLLDFISANHRDNIRSILTSTKIPGILEADFEYTKPQTHTKNWIMLRVYPVYKHNNIVRNIYSFTDITKEKKSQKAVEEALLYVQKANEAKKVFLSHMSHELKTPINAIIGMAQIASRSLDDKEKAENCLEKINTSSRKLLKLINNILDISKIDSDKLILKHEPFHLTDILTPFTSMMNIQAELKSQEFVFLNKNVRDNCLIGDSLRLIQILENCISNSLKFTPLGGKITLEVSEIERHRNKALFQFTISDTGKGMSEEYLDRLFVPFEQEDDTIALKYGGTGLGMSITKELIQLMGGNIQVASKPGIGTTVTIDIVFHTTTDNNLPMESKEGNVEPAEYDCSDIRVLVVEDNDINLEITCEFLNFMKAIAVPVTNGYDAIKLFTSSEADFYQVILMDLQMPELDGYETVKAIRSALHPDAKKVCIVAMTADDFSDNRLSIDSGMDYHITKPLEIEKLYSILQNTTTNKSIAATDGRMITNE